MGATLTGCLAVWVGCGPVGEDHEGLDVQGGGAVGKELAATEQEEAVPAKAYPPESTDPTKATIRSAVLAELEEPGDTMKVVLFVAEDPISVAQYTGGEYGEAAYEDGMLVDAKLNGVPTDNIGLAASSVEMRKGFVKARMAAEESRRTKWKELASALGLGSELAGAIASGAASAEVTLSKEKISKAGNLSSAVLFSVGVPFQPLVGAEPYIPFSTALASVDLSTLAFPGGWDGSGIGIFSTDDDRINSAAHPCIKTASARLFRYGSIGAPYGRDHVNGMVCTIQASAPQARVFYASIHQGITGGCGEGFPSEAIPNGTTAPPVWIAHTSVNSPGVQPWNTYGDCNRLHDNSVMLNRISRFVCTNQWADPQYALEPSTAFNNFGIGMSYAGVSPNVMGEGSNWIDPDTQAVKPDLVAPGQNIILEGTQTGGSSASAAMAAGFAADLLEQKAQFRGRPALLKSYLIANGQRIASEPPGLWGDHDGYGEMDYSNAQSGAWNWWDGTATQHFTQDEDGDGKMEIVYTRYISSAGNWRVVASWLADGNTALSTKRAHLNLNVRVYSPSGTLMGSSSHARRNVEILAFQAVNTGDYKVIIEKEGTNGPGDLVLGVTIRKR